MYQLGLYAKVWPEVAAYRASGGLMECAGRVHCPVAAIHGDYDPHPADAVRVIPNVEFHLLANCGHLPWLERHAAGQFYRLVEESLVE